MSQDEGVADAQVACRKSKRLLFKNTQKANALKNITRPHSDSVNPYGRLVELVDTRVEMDRDDLLTKVLFLGSLDLTFQDSAVKHQKNECSPEMPSSSNSSNAPLKPKKRVFVVGSLKNLCVKAMVKKMKYEHNQKEEAYFSQLEKVAEDESNGWKNFNEYMTDLLELDGKESGEKELIEPRCDPLALEECVEKVLRCGTQVVFQDTCLPVRIQNLLKTGAGTDQSRSEGSGNSEGWLSWDENGRSFKEETNNSLDKRSKLTDQGLQPPTPPEASIKTKSARSSKRGKHAVQN